MTAQDIDEARAFAREIVAEMRPHDRSEFLSDPAAWDEGIATMRWDGWMRGFSVSDVRFAVLEELGCECVDAMVLP